MAIASRIIIPLPDVAATRRLAQAVAAIARPGDTIALSGDLGAGKTEFARAFVRARTGRADEDVPSPTFTLVQTYADGPGHEGVGDDGTGEILHADLYRIAGPDEALELGLEDAFGRDLVLLEWPERIARLLPRDRLDIVIAIGTGDDDGDTGRQATLVPHASWIERMTELAV